MCLSTRYPKIKTAKTDIVVFKFLAAGMTSPFQGSRWAFGETQRLRKKLKSDGGSSIEYFHEGFHSFKSRDAAIEYYCKPSGVAQCSLYTATIPRGAKYVVGSKGDIVSTSLKVTGLLLDAMELQVARWKNSRG